MLCVRNKNNSLLVFGSSEDTLTFLNGVLVERCAMIQDVDLSFECDENNFAGSSGGNNTKVC